MSSTHPHQQHIVTPSDDPTRAAVENLIASIKSKQLQETQRQSDRKILDIIHRVLGRTVDLVYDEDEKERIHHEGEQKLRVDDDTKISVIAEEEDKSVTLRVPDVSRMEVDLYDDDEQVNERDGDGESLTGREEKTATRKSTMGDENIDMSNDPLYRRILSGITKEDLLNVRGTQINVPTPLIPRTQALSAKKSKHDDKTVHQFCTQTVDELDVLPKEIRAITQLYHQRARFRHQLPMSSDYFEHGQLPIFPKREKIENEENEQIA